LFSISLFFSWLCASLFSFDILLLQRLGVIGIFAIIIYFLKQKMKLRRANLSQPQPSVPVLFPCLRQ
jgi:hypothetical protein